MLQRYNIKDYRKAFITLNASIVLLLSCFFTASCTSSRNAQSSIGRTQLKQLEERLDISIDAKTDNLLFLLESASWLGTPYKYGGKDKKGIDCSALVHEIYSNAFHIHLSNCCADILNKDKGMLVDSDKLQMGDLVFFDSPKSKSISTHVGAYLKDHKFIHASSSRGVMISSLNDAYWEKHWIVGKRMK